MNQNPGSLSVIGRFIRPYTPQVIYALVALVITAGITLSLGQSVRLLIDDGFSAGSPEQLLTIIQWFALLIAGLAIGTFCRYYWVSWLGERIITDLRKAVFQNLISLHPGYFEHNRSLEIQSRLTADTTVLQGVIGSSASVALRNIILFIGGLLWMFFTNAKLTLIVLGAVPVVVVPILYFGRRVRKLSRRNQDRVADVGAYVGEVLGHIKTVQAYTHELSDRQRFDEVTEQAFAVARERILQRGWLVSVVILLVLGAIAFMLWTGGNDVFAGKITGGELGAFVFYAIIVGSAAGSISEVISELQRAAGALERIVELLYAKNEIREVDDAATLVISPVSASIRFEDVTFHYPSRRETPAIRHFTLSIEAGKTIALVGPSGAGKSTLFDLLMRFYEPETGSIHIAGQDLRSLTLQSLRQQIAFVSQTPTLFHGTIAQNIAYGRPEATEHELIDAAKAAHAHEFIQRLPNAYQTHLGDLGLGLSGGQKQRLAIARALLVDAPVLLLDEATSALDAESEHLVQQALEHLMRDRTTLVIAHRLATVRNVDRIVVMDQGQVVEMGSHEDLMRNSGLYQRFARLQFNAAAAPLSGPNHSEAPGSL